MKIKDNKQLNIGVILILFGTGLFLLQYAQKYQESITLIIIGGIFLVFYFLKKKYGVLIPGCILLGLGIGSLTSNSMGWLGDLHEIGLGLGFCLIYVISSIYEGKAHWWPLIPGVILLCTGLAEGHRILLNTWPLILVLIGALLIFREIRRKGDGNVKDFSKPEE